MQVAAAGGDGSGGGAGGSSSRGPPPVEDAAQPPASTGIATAEAAQPQPSLQAAQPPAHEQAAAAAGRALARLPHGILLVKKGRRHYHATTYITSPARPGGKTLQVRLAGCATLGEAAAARDLALLWRRIKGLEPRKAHMQPYLLPLDRWGGQCFLNIMVALQLGLNSYRAACGVPSFGPGMLVALNKRSALAGRASGDSHPSTRLPACLPTHPPSCSYQADTQLMRQLQQAADHRQLQALARRLRDSGRLAQLAQQAKPEDVGEEEEEEEEEAPQAAVPGAQQRREEAAAAPAAPFQSEQAGEEEGEGEGGEEGEEAPSRSRPVRRGVVRLGGYLHAGAPWLSGRYARKAAPRDDSRSSDGSGSSDSGGGRGGTSDGDYEDEGREESGGGEQEEGQARQPRQPRGRSTRGRRKQAAPSRHLPAKAAAAAAAAPVGAAGNSPHGTSPGGGGGGGGGPGAVPEGGAEALVGWLAGQQGGGGGGQAPHSEGGLSEGGSEEGSLRLLPGSPDVGGGRLRRRGGAGVAAAPGGAGRMRRDAAGGGSREGPRQGQDGTEGGPAAKRARLAPMVPRAEDGATAAAAAAADSPRGSSHHRMVQHLIAAASQPGAAAAGLTPHLVGSYLAAQQEEQVATMGLLLAQPGMWQAAAKLMQEAASGHQS